MFTTLSKFWHRPASSVLVKPIDESDKIRNGRDLGRHTYDFRKRKRRLDHSSHFVQHMVRSERVSTKDALAMIKQSKNLVDVDTEGICVI